MNFVVFHPFEVCPVTNSFKKIMKLNNNVEKVASLLPPPPPPPPPLKERKRRERQWSEKLRLQTASAVSTQENSFI